MTTFTHYSILKKLNKIRLKWLALFFVLLIVELVVIYFKVQEVIVFIFLHWNVKLGWIQSLGKNCQQAERTFISEEHVIDKPITEGSLPFCTKVPPKLLGKLNLDKEGEDVNLNKLTSYYNWIDEGGKYKPSECEAKSKIAIIVPHRNREVHLRQFLKTIHPILRRQQAEYQIFVVQQAGTGTFNRAKLLNIGYKEALNDGDFDCFIFHDVDLLAEDDRNLYRCSNNPRHLSVAVDKFGYQIPYHAIFGGATAMRKKEFSKVNGYSNEYWGWGAEDDDMHFRIMKSCLVIEEANYNVARYRMVSHAPDKDNSANPYRYKLLSGAVKRQSTDGLSNLNYSLVKKFYSPLYTNITVDIGNPSVKPNLSKFGTGMNVTFSLLLLLFTFILICLSCFKSRLVHIIICPRR